MIFVHAQDCILLTRENIRIDSEMYYEMESCSLKNRIPSMLNNADIVRFISRHYSAFQKIFALRHHAYGRFFSPEPFPRLFLRQGQKVRE